MSREPAGSGLAAVVGVGSVTRPRGELPLAGAAGRLRGSPGRPGAGVQRAASPPASAAAMRATLPALCQPRGLSVKETAAVLGLPVRSVWRLVRHGVLRPVRWPGLRRVHFDRHDVEALFGDVYKV
jgi:excisionase family DNA binding protein